MFAATALIPISDATALGFLNPIFGLFYAIPITIIVLCLLCLKFETFVNLMIKKNNSKNV